MRRSSEQIFADTGRAHRAIQSGRVNHD